MSNDLTTDVTQCNFCNKPREQVFRLVTNERGDAICNECVAICVNIINEDIDKLKLPKIQYHT